MLSLADYTSPQLIEPRLQSRGTAAVLAELCSRLERSGRVEDPLSFYNCVVTREKLSSTAMAPGWALPHGRSNTARQLSFALGRSAVPLDWAETGKPEVRLVFLFAVPEAQASQYLALVSALARLSQKPERWEPLLHAPDTHSIFELLQRVPLSEPRPVAARNRSPKPQPSLS